MKSAVQFCSKVFLYTLIVLICFEVSLLLSGYRAYKNIDYKVDSTTSYPFRGHEDFGFCLNPGEFQITLNNKVNFLTKHSEGGCRISPKNKEISINENTAFLGCSFTYGYGVDFDQTFADLVQKKLNFLNIKNYAVPGYGTVQSFLQLPSILQNDSLRNVVLCISSVHLDRNVMSQQFRSSLKIGFVNSSDAVEESMSGARFPYIRDTSLNLLYDSWNDLYDNYFLREYLASANYVQSTMDKISDDKLEKVDVTTAILQKMNIMCQENDVQFLIVCLDDTAEMKVIENELSHIPWLNVSFDFTKKDLTFLPIDSHPNGDGHRFIAKRITQFLSEKLLGNE